VQRNGGTHPLIRPAGTRLLRRMRAWALPPLQGAGLADPAPAGAGNSAAGTRLTS
jgi:hypothetical protein